MSLILNELLKHLGALIAISSALGATVFYFFYQIYRSRKYHLKELKALGFYQDNTRETMNERTGLKERRVSSKIRVYWQSNKLVFSKYNRALGVKNFEALKPNLESFNSYSVGLIEIVACEVLS